MSSVIKLNRWTVCLLLVGMAAVWAGSAAFAEDSAAFLATMDNASATLRYPAWTNAAKQGAAVLVPLGERMDAGDRSKRQDLSRAMTEIVHNAGRPGADAERKAAVAELAKLLSPERSPLVKNETLDLIGFIADAGNLPAIEPLLKDPAVREEACRAIERIPGHEATRVLEKNLDTLPPDFQPRALASLGHRHDDTAGPALEAFIGKASGDLKLQALEAMSKSGALPPKGLGKIFQALGAGVDRDVKANIRLRFADSLLAKGQKDRAVKIYTSLSNAEAGEQIKAAAEDGLKRASGEKK